MAEVSTEKWIKFFSKAGIPPRAAATYALTFSDNRIQLDMLLDLNKEYLRDMGITLMGDVIAILRHARQVHEELTHEKLLSSAKGPSSVVKPVTNLRDTSSSSPSAKTLKTVKVVKPAPKESSSSSSFSSSSSQSSSTPSPPKKVSVSSRISDPNPKPLLSGRSAGPSSSSQTLASVKLPAKKVVTPAEPLKRRAAEISRPKPSVERLENEDVPVPIKKVRRVLPEHEGGYKIKMPSGSTPRSQQILAKQKEIASKKTVFDRLGGSTSPGADPLTAAVSSTTSDPTFTVTGLEAAKKAKASSVFSRLGDKQVSSTSALAVAEGTLPFAGILKNVSSKPVSKAPIPVQKTSSMVADSVISTNRDVQSRIGTMKEVTVVKRSATFVSVPKQEYGLKRSSSAVFAPKQATEVKRVATVVPLMKRTQGVRTAGILAGNQNDVNRTVKSRLGVDDPPRSLQVASVKRVPRIEVPRLNGSASGSFKRVTFENTPGKVSVRSNVFSRLGS
ncbi:uncharacterized protein C19orf47 isoform X2 [Thrips palmi]|uniref:Uncharacterized protein C19orf47 isoform X2 n=1 Tax=Thrips palmi TaxID=161013 RepID=A0A6P8Y6P6_THRPL|nr:uncharacterized protein C19orf47 isoform X2 [Thrips palmi]